MAIKRLPKHLSHDNLMVQYADNCISRPYVWTCVDVVPALKARELKLLAKECGLKQSGNKEQLYARVKLYLILSHYATLITRVWRGYVVRLYWKLHGPALKNREICKNTADFITMDPLNEIPGEQFISYVGPDGAVYGFDTVSIIHFREQLKSKYGSDPDKIREHWVNPYTREPFVSGFWRGQIKKLLRIATVLGRVRYIYTQVQPEPDPIMVADPFVSMTISMESFTEWMVRRRATHLCQHMDGFGNYTNPAWFCEMSHEVASLFIWELSDIWQNRANISAEMQREIIVPDGNPFRNIVMYPMYFNDPNPWAVRSLVLDIVERMTCSGVSHETQSFGTYYVIGALTLANSDIGDALPILRDAFRR